MLHFGTSFMSRRLAKKIPGRVPSMAPDVVIRARGSCFLELGNAPHFTSSLAE